MQAVPLQQPIQIVVDQPRAPSKIRLWHVAVAGIVVFYAVRWVRSLVKRWTRYRRDVRCQGIAERILVLIYSYRNSNEAAATVMSLMRTASCPSNVSFAVFQEFEDAKDADVYNACVSMCTDAEERERVDLMRVISREDAKATSKGPLYGIRSAFKQAWKGEAFALVCPCGVRAVADWDAAWIEEYENAIKTLPWEGAIALTCEPEKMRSINNAASKDVAPVFEDGLGAVAQNFIRNMNETSQASIVARPRYTYPVLGRMNGRFPEVGTRLFPQKNEEAVQSLILGSCTMTSARTLKTALRFATMDCPPYAANFVLSALMHTHARTSFVAATPMFLQVSRPRSMRPARWDSRRLQEVIMSSYGEYADFCGVDIERSIATGRGLMGVLPDLESADILSKYGSRREFERIKAQFK